MPLADAFDRGDEVEVTENHEIFNLDKSEKLKTLKTKKSVKVLYCQPKKDDEDKKECLLEWDEHRFFVPKDLLKESEEKEDSGGSDEKEKIKKKIDEEKISRPGNRRGKKLEFGSPICGCKGAGACRFGSGYGPRVPPTRRASSFHRARDIPAPEGTPVAAVEAGAVSKINLRGYGNQLEVVHDSTYKTRYAHLVRLKRTSGWVEKGEVIGYVGETGVATGPHLHFEVLKKGKKVNPDKYVSPSKTSLTKACKKVESRGASSNGSRGRRGRVIE